MDRHRKQLYLQLFFSNCLGITAKKGADYDPDDIPLMDTLAHAVDTDVEVYQVLWIYYGKHASAIRRYVREGKVESEPLEGRFMDAANYLGLMSFYNTFTRELHAAWRQHWTAQPCEYDTETKLHNGHCPRCQTLAWLDQRQFALGSSKT